MIGEVLYNILSNNAAISGIVGTKIMPSAADQNTAHPYITYQTISTAPNKSKDRAIEIKTLRVQIDMFATTFAQVSSLADAVLDALSFYSGTNSGETVDIIVFEDENELYSDQSEIFRKSHDYTIRLKY